MPPKTRKKRQAAAATANSAAEKASTPLAHPPRTNPTDSSSGTRTLYDIIAERQNALLSPEERSSSARKNGNLPPRPGTRVVTVDVSGAVVDADKDSWPTPSSSSSSSTKPTTAKRTQPNSKNKQNKESGADQQPLPPFLDTILLSLPLTTLHVTLSWLAAHQYAEQTDLSALLKDSILITFPLLTFLIHLTHGHIISFPFSRSKPTAPKPTDSVSIFPLTNDKLTLTFLRKLIFPPTLRTLFVLPLSILLGAHLIAITNGAPYYAVMKKAPAVGTLWIWCILEMSFGAAVLGAMGPLVWGVWWMGYGIV